MPVQGDVLVPADICGILIGSGGSRNTMSTVVCFHLVESVTEALW